MSDYGIVQFAAHYYPKGYNILKDFSIKLDEIKTKKDLINQLEFSDLRDMYFEDAGQIGIWDKLDQAIAMNGNVKKSFITYIATGFAGSSEDDFYTSGVHYAFDSDVSAEMEYFVEDAFPEFLKIFENHKLLSHEYRNKQMELKDYKDVLSINVPTLWSFSGGFDSFTNEYDYEVEWLGIIDIKKIKIEEPI